MQRERGGILAAVVVGVVLCALLAGAIATSKNQGRHASTAQTATTVKSDDKTGTQKQPELAPIKENTATKDTKDDKNTGSTDTKKPEQPTPQQTTPPAKTPPTPQPTHQVANTGPSDIATTGPGDVIFTAISLAALTAAITAYRRSHTNLVTRALR